MRLWRAIGLGGALLIIWVGVARAAAERRVALVIGNSQYESVARLPNPKPDSEIVAASLREAGFTSVSQATDLTREKLVDVLRRFASEAEHADWAVVYYAGHGIEMNGMNYLIPVDAHLKSDRDLQFEAVPMSQVLGAVDGARKLRLLVLDACRDNPFASSMTRSTGATRSIGRGLARIEPDAGTLVAYAAKHGQVAEDGEDAHSPFVTSLMKHIATPGLEINRLFRRVTSDVLVATNRRQEPFTYGSLPDEDFYFRSALPPQASKTESVPTPPAPVAPSAATPPGTTAQPALVPAVTAPEPASTPQQATTVSADSIARPVPQPEPRKQVASVDPAGAPAVAVRPVAPRVREQSVTKPKVIHRPGRASSRPKRVAQAVERPKPRIVRSTPRGLTSSARGGGSCFTFNGNRVCD